MLLLSTLLLLLSCRTSTQSIAGLASYCGGGASNYCFNSTYCSNGTCLNGRCYQGVGNPPSCNTLCPQGTYGPLCNNTCRCNPGASCSPINGICSDSSCACGWTGPGCASAVNANCTSNSTPSLTPVAGVPSVCGSASTAHCYAASHCVASTAAAAYCNATFCYQGFGNAPYCDSYCPQGTFGYQCSYTCHCNANATCLPVNGICSDSLCACGWTGVGCQTPQPCGNTTSSSMQTSTTNITTSSSTAPSTSSATTKTTNVTTSNSMPQTTSDTSPSTTTTTTMTSTSTSTPVTSTSTSTTTRATSTSTLTPSTSTSTTPTNSASTTPPITSTFTSTSTSTTTPTTFTSTTTPLTSTSTSTSSSTTTTPTTSTSTTTPLTSTSTSSSTTTTPTTSTSTTTPVTSTATSSSTTTTPTTSTSTTTPVTSTATSSSTTTTPTTSTSTTTPVTSTSTATSTSTTTTAPTTSTLTTTPVISTTTLTVAIPSSGYFINSNLTSFSNVVSGCELALSNALSKTCVVATLPESSSVQQFYNMGYSVAGLSFWIYAEGTSPSTSDFVWMDSGNQVTYPDWCSSSTCGSVADLDPTGLCLSLYCVGPTNCFVKNRECVTTLPVLCYCS